MSGTGALFTALNDLAGAGVTGGVALLSGNAGQYVVFGLVLTVVAMVVGGIFYIIHLARGKRS